MARLELLIVLSIVGSLGLAGAAFGSAAHASTSSTVVSTKQTSLGTILVNASGQTLYLDTADKPPHFGCTGACLKTWPPLKAIGAVKAAGAAKASLLGRPKAQPAKQPPTPVTRSTHSSRIAKATQLAATANTVLPP